ncbi:MAG: fumarylacetoacetate hydrolase family protein [bacterium]|nr:fumarylacetoacetate hydrolase family protein [bacterium]
MKIARFLGSDGGEHYGEPVSDDTARLIEGSIFGPHRLGDATATIARLLPPVSPPNVFGIGLNYRAHAAEGGRELPEHPLIFIKATTSVIAAGEPIRLPPSAPDEVDYEAELAIVIGRRASRVTVEQAPDYVLGYTCANDVTARDCQKRIDRQWTRAKGFDTFCPLGPWLVTPDAFDPGDAAVECCLNDEVMQQGRTSDLVFDGPTLISYLSHQFTLLPGTVICTGTPAGVGFSRQPPVFLSAGDQVSVRISGIGTLINPVGA